MAGWSAGREAHGSHLADWAKQLVRKKRYLPTTHDSLVLLLFSFSSPPPVNTTSLVQLNGWKIRASSPWAVELGPPCLLFVGNRLPTLQNVISCWCMDGIDRVQDPCTVKARHMHSTTMAPSFFFFFFFFNKTVLRTH